MKKLELCKTCEITSECETYCQDAVEFEKLDTSDNYMKEKYEPKAKKAWSWNECRQSGGLSRFK